MNETCGVVTASCRCLRGANHEGPHVCDCGGAWLDVSPEDFRIYALPAAKGVIRSAAMADALVASFIDWSRPA